MNRLERILCYSRVALLRIRSVAKNNVIARIFGITVESEKVVIKLLQFFTTRERNNHNIAILLVVIFTSHKEYFMILFLTFNSYGIFGHCCMDQIFDVIPARCYISSDCIKYKSGVEYRIEYIKSKEWYGNSTT